MVKFNKIQNKVNALNPGINKQKITYTILVIYYLYYKCKDKLNEYQLIINKAYKFLLSNKIIYPNIIIGI